MGRREATGLGGSHVEEDAAKLRGKTKTINYTNIIDHDHANMVDHDHTNLITHSHHL